MNLPKNVRLQIEQFENSWCAGAPVDCAGVVHEAMASSVPPLDRDGANALLVRVIEIDMEYRGRNSKVGDGNTAAWGLASYAGRIPFLGNKEQWPRDLIAAEFRTRWEWADRPPVESFLADYPEQRDALLPRLRDIESSLAGIITPNPIADAAQDVSPRVPSEELADGKGFPQFGRYRVESKLGGGGYGVVYKAWDLKLNRYVAIKLLKPETQGDVIADLRLKAEARILALLEHNHIVRIWDVGEHDKSMFLVLEYVDGGHLGEKIGRKPLPNAEAATIALSLADALETAHQAGVIHRDLKPANVLLESGGGGRAKISDFGLARLLESILTRDSDQLGTPNYMSPEQAGDSSSRNLTAATDIYSLGAILYEMLTGRPPFVGRVEAVLFQVTHKDPQPIRGLNPNAAKDLVTICGRCMEKSPAARFASAKLLREELRRYLANEPLTIKPPGLIERLGKRIQRRPLEAGMYAAGLLALVMAVFTVLYYGKYRDADVARGREAEARGVAETAKEREATLREQLVRITYGHQVALAYQAWQGGRISDAADLLAQCPQRLRNWEWFFVNRLCDSAAISLRGHTGSIAAVAFSSNGKNVATSGGKSVRIWDTSLGKQLLNIDNLSSTPTYLSFIDANTRLVGYVLEEGKGRLLSWNATTGAAELPIDFPNGLPVGFSDEAHFCVTVPTDAKAPGIVVRKVKTGQEVSHFTPVAREHVTFNLDSRMILTWSKSDPAVEFFFSMDGSAAVRLKNNKTGIVCAAVGNGLIALGFGDGTLSFWDPETGDEVWTVKPFTAMVTSISLGTDIVPAGSDDPSMRTPRLDPRILVTNRALVTCADGSSRFVNPFQRKLVAAFPDHAGSVTAAALSPDGKCLVTGGADGLVLILNAGAKRDALQFRPQRAFGVRMAITRDGQRLATCSANGSGNVCDTGTLGQITAFAESHGRANAIAFSRDEKQVFIGGGDGSVRLCDAATGADIRTFGPLATGCAAIALNPKGDVLAAAYLDGTVTAWDIQAAGQRRSAPVAKEIIRSLSFSPDGKRIAVASESNTLQILDARTLGWVASISNPDAAFTSAFYFHHGERIASSMRNGAVKIWDAATGQLLFTLSGHTERATWVAVTPDDQRVVSVSDDQNVKIWDTMTGQEILTIPGRTTELENVVVSEDGSRIVAACGVGLVRIWLAR